MRRHVASPVANTSAVPAMSRMTIMLVWLVEGAAAPAAAWPSAADPAIVARHIKHAHTIAGALRPSVDRDDDAMLRMRVQQLILSAAGLGCTRRSMIWMSEAHPHSDVRGAWQPIARGHFTQRWRSQVRSQASTARTARSKSGHNRCLTM